MVQPLWFFERARGQYEQPMMQMTKKQKDDYKLVRPKDKKFTLTDLAKYMNAAAMLPYYVSWGGEVNAAHFHNNMVKQWNKDNTVFNELFYKELIGKKIMFAYIEHVISDQQWYQERRAYRPQIVAYTFSKLVYEAQRAKKRINYRQIWDNQKVSDIFETDIARIGKLVFDLIYDENRSTANIETYCKKRRVLADMQQKYYEAKANIEETFYSSINTMFDDDRVDLTNQLIDYLNQKRVIYALREKKYFNEIQKIDDRNSKLASDIQKDELFFNEIENLTNILKDSDIENREMIIDVIAYLVSDEWLKNFKSDDDELYSLLLEYGLLA